MNNDFQNISGATSLLIELDKYLSMYFDFYNSINEIVKNIESTMEYLYQMIQKLIIYSTEYIKAYTRIELTIAAINNSIYDYNYQPQAPPIEKSIIETAIENFNYNRKHCKILKLFKQEMPVLVKEIIVSIIVSLILKLLGMQ